jgi:hypothetical protein
VVTVNNLANEYSGLSTDEKPTDGIGNGSIFVEIDTGKVYFYDAAGQTWIEQFSFQG